MTTIGLKRQWIRDDSGLHVGVILPLEEYALVREILEQKRPASTDEAKVALMRQAVQDPLFIADLQATMTVFAETDGDWWEPTS